MITPEEAGRLKEQLLAVLTEDAANSERLLARLDAVSRETGISAHAALLMILTHLAFDDAQARRHWEAILSHRDAMTAALGRDAGLRVALLDYFMNINQRLVRPILIDLEMFDAGDSAGATDVLTGLATDRLFRSEIQTELRRAKRYGHTVPLVLFDLDDFARVNDQFGRLVADRLLREAAILLHNKIRDIDVASRPGEDEMALLLPETDRRGAILVAERYRWELESHFARREVGGAHVNLTVSAGIACYPDDATAPEDLVERAAQALYRAKACGKNAVQVFQPERRRYLRFDLEPGRVEVEVIAPRDLGKARPLNLGRSGVVFTSPELLDVGEEIEIRLVDASRSAREPLRLRGRVVRLEELPTPGGGRGDAERAGVEGDRYEVGVAFDLDWGGVEQDLLGFLENLNAARPGVES